MLRMVPYHSDISILFVTEKPESGWWGGPHSLLLLGSLGGGVDFTVHSLLLLGSLGGVDLTACCS